MLLTFSTMVDSRKGGVMADRIDHLTERVQVVEVKVDRLSSTVNELAAAMVAGFVEQREYTEFSHARLEATIDAGYAQLEAKMDAGHAQLEAKMDAGYTKLEAKMDVDLGRVDRKLDQLIDAGRSRSKPNRRNE